MYPISSSDFQQGELRTATALITPTKPIMLRTVPVGARVMPFHHGGA
jgi:hypothetical protein